MLMQFFGTLEPLSDPETKVVMAYRPVEGAASSANFTLRYVSRGVVEIILEQWIAGRPAVAISPVSPSPGWESMSLAAHQISYSDEKKQYTLTAYLLSTKEQGHVDVPFSFTLICGRSVTLDIDREEVELDAAMLAFGAHSIPTVEISCESVAFDRGTVVQIETSHDACTLSLPTSARLGEDLYTLAAYTYSAGQVAPIKWTENPSTGRQSFTVVIPEAVGVATPFQRFVVAANPPPNAADRTRRTSDPVALIRKKGPS